MASSDTARATGAPRHGIGELPALPSQSKHAVICLALAFGVFCLLGAAYLLAVELATPRKFWLDENRLFDPSRLSSATPIGPVEYRFARWLPEPGVHSRFALCDARLRAALAAGDWKSVPERRTDCIHVIEDALQSLPASAPLWYHHARLLAQADFASAAANRSLSMSYKTGAREGWLVPRRLVFALLRWDQLPDELRGHAGTDAWTMLQSWEQLKGLATIYWSNPALREPMVELIDRQATAKQKTDFTWLVSELMRGNRLP